MLITQSLFAAASFGAVAASSNPAVVENPLRDDRAARSLTPAIAIKPSISHSPQLTIGKQIITLGTNGFVLDGTNLLPGAKQTTISGIPLSIDKQGDLVIVHPIPSGTPTTAAGGNVHSTGTASQKATVKPSSSLSVKGTRITSGQGSPGSRSSGAPNVSYSLLSSGGLVEIMTSNDQTLKETFVPTTYPQYKSLTKSLTTYASIASNSLLPIIVGPGGIGWGIPARQSGHPDLPLPTVLPTEGLSNKPNPSQFTIPSGSNGVSRTSKISSPTKGFTSSKQSGSTASSVSSQTQSVTTKVNDGPTTAPPSPTLTSSYTFLGSDVQSTTLAGITQNTKITTSERGHQTVLPVVWCPGCGGGGGRGGGLNFIIHPPGGIHLGGLTLNLPGVDFPFTIGPDGIPKPANPQEPTPKPSPSDPKNSQSSPSFSRNTLSESRSTTKASSRTSSTSSCTAITTSACHTVCPVGAGAKRVAAGCTSSCSTVTGCSATVSGSSTAVCDAKATCVPYSPVNVQTEDEANVDGDVSDFPTKRDLGKRKSKAFTEIGTCALVGTKGFPAYPEWPNGKTMNDVYTQLDRPGAGEYFPGKKPDDMSTVRYVGWYVKKAGSCAISADYDRSITHPPSGKEGKNSPSTDHVWEKSLLRRFLISIIETKLNCDDFNTVFMKTPLDHTCDGEDSVIQRLYNQLPRKYKKDMPNHIEFMGTSGYINAIKGVIFGPAGHDLSSVNFKDTHLRTPEDAAAALGTIATVFNILRSETRVRQLFSITNQRMHNAFQGITDFVKDKELKGKDSKPINIDWASEYLIWMQAEVKKAAMAAEAFVSQQVKDLQSSQEAIQKDDKATAEKKKVACTILANLEAFKKSAQGPGKGYYSGFDWDWDLTGTAMPFKRSLDERDGSNACSKPASVVTSQVHKPTLPSAISQTLRTRFTQSTPSHPVTTSSVRPRTSAPPPPPAYVTGTCTLHVDEYQVCTSMDRNLYAVVTIKDAAGKVIGTTPNDNPLSIGVQINDKDPYSLRSKLAHPLGITGEHENDYIQFTLGSMSWKSRDSDQSAPAYCSNGGWDPREGPLCGARFPNRGAKNQIDCWFKC